MLKIDRRPGEKLRCRGKVHGTFTVQLCDKEMRGIYNTSVVVRLELKNMAQVFMPAYSDKWSKYGEIELKQSGDGVTFLVHYDEGEVAVLRTELICKNGKDQWLT